MNIAQMPKFNIFLKNAHLFLFVVTFFSFSLLNYAQEKYTIVLDAGHGGKDPGNMGNGFKEKDIALKVALVVGEELKKREDVRVVFTRKTDEFIDLWKRGEIANKEKATLFVSIHCDSHTSNAYGAGTFVLGLRGNKKNLEIAKRENAVILLEDNYEKRYEGFDPNSAESVIGLSLLQEENLDKSLEIASLIQNNFAVKLKRNDRKVKQDNFQVLRETIMPSVLVELGFLTNKNEGKYLNSKKGQQQMGKAVSDAILDYVDHLKLNTVTEKIVVDSKNRVEYKVQIASGKNKIDTKAYNFRGLNNVERVKVGSYYKYYFGSSIDYEVAVKALQKAKEKGYTSAFLVAFANGEKVSVTDAKKMQD